MFLFPSHGLCTSSHAHMKTEHPHTLHEQARGVAWLDSAWLAARVVYMAGLTILKEKPFINRQKDNFINSLKIYSRTTT